MYDLKIQEKQAAEAFHRFAAHERLITMNEEAIKEFISINFIRLIAEREGFIVTKPNVDLGDDLMIKQVKHVESNGKLSYYTSGRLIEFQLKCTTEKSIKEKNGFINYSLKTRNYNHLIYRQKDWLTEKYVPLILILIVLENEKRKWLEIDVQKGGGLKIGARAFWYLPTSDATVISEKTQLPISIPAENQVDLNFFTTTFNKYF